ncbi:uncharacterized protein LODBEIA_P49460 [Lodderomyces beijingensis]|uniref:Uncharacterized protein n=1 Tax=Lodderomyces beijingensis TaxID=1775926 RepID=A0ABP0ZRG7_9ASCO
MSASVADFSAFKRRKAEIPDGVETIDLSSDEEESKRSQGGGKVRGDAGDKNNDDGHEGDNNDDDDDLMILDSHQVSNISFKPTHFSRFAYSQPDPSNLTDRYRLSQAYTPRPGGSSFSGSTGLAFVQPNRKIPTQLSFNSATPSVSSNPVIYTPSAPQASSSNSHPLPISEPSPLAMPGAWNTPAPVPHADQDLGGITRDELEQRAELKLAEIKTLTESRNNITRQMQSHQAQYEMFSRISRKLQTELSQANSMGDHGSVFRIRRQIGKAQRLMDAPRQLVNNLQKQLNKMEDKIGIRKREIEAFNAKIRGLGHSLNASFNPYEAQISRDFQQQHSSFNSNHAGAGDADFDLQNLLDNIRPDEITEEGLANTPQEMSVNLLKHQRIGLTWLKRMEESKSKGGILADDMGLGKTIQTLALIIANRSQDAGVKTTLIVAPVSLLRQWAAEIDSKTKPSFHIEVGIFHGEEKKNMASFASMKKYDVVLTSYGTLASEFKRHFSKELRENKDRGKTFLPRPDTGGESYTSPFFGRNSQFHRVVLDEAQNIKNKFAIASKAVIYLKSEYRFCLSGTPMQNNIDELFPIIRFLKIRPYCIEEKFRADIAIPVKSKSEYYDEMDKSNSMRKLRALLSSILLRRNKNSLIDGQPILQLPEKHIISDYVELKGEELDYYKQVELGVQKLARKILGTSQHSSVLTLLLRLRQACCHSYLVEIGETKAREKSSKEEEEGGGGGGFWSQNDWRKQLRTICELPETITNEVKARVTSEESQFSCPVCYDAVDESSKLAIFAECGHRICQACVNTFFDNTLVEEEKSTSRLGQCIECRKNVREANVCDYAIFHRLYIDGLDVAEVERLCASQYSKTSLTNLSIIKQLTARDQGFEPSAKIEKAVELITQIQEANPGQKIIIFSQFTTLFDLMRLVLDHQSIRHLRYDGSLSVEAKNAVIKQFYQTDKDVLLLSLRAGNVGLTLTCANHVIIMDPFWNPFVEEQAMDRAHRIGQQREVHVHRVLIANTVESRIVQLQEAKKELIGDALNENEMKSISKLGRRELGFLFGLNGLR